MWTKKAPDQGQGLEFHIRLEKFWLTFLMQLYAHHKA